MLFFFFFLLTGCSSSAPAEAPAPAAEPPPAPDAPPPPDPSVWRATGSMTHARMTHTATLLGDGTVLVAGGELLADRSMLASAEIFDPKTERR